MSDEEWGDRYAQLEVLRRLLDAAVAAQINRIVSITPGGLVNETIREDTELTLHRSPVGLKIEATYAELLSFVRSFQSDDKYLSIEVSDVVPSDRAEDSTEGVVEATLTAVGIDLGVARVVEKRGGRSSGRKRGF